MKMVLVQLFFIVMSSAVSFGDDSNVLMPLIGDTPEVKPTHVKPKTKKKTATKVKKDAPVAVAQPQETDDSDPQTIELENRVRASQAEAQKALQKAKEEQALLIELKAKKLRNEKLMAKKQAKIEADRQAKVNDYRSSRAKVEMAQKNFKSLVQEAKLARSELEEAIKEADAKGEDYKQAALKLNIAPTLSTPTDRVPASVAASAPEVPAQKEAPRVSPPAKNDSELKWSDEK